MKANRVMLADSYKYSHADQYPQNTISMYSYMESRGGLYSATKFFGLQYYLKEYFSIPITQSEVDEAYQYAEAHGVPFDIKGWTYIVKELNGFLPVRIKAVPEGSLIPTSNVLMTIESTDHNVPWITGWLETILMKIWYPTTVATKSHYVKEMLKQYGSEDWAKFAYHNFGDRGSTSVESAGIGGMAHLAAGFYGTDNFNSLTYAKEFYGSNIAAYSVIASEHSSTTSYGKDGEEEFVLNLLESNPDAPIISVVADSYDVFKFVDMCTAQNSTIREIVESRPHQKLVLRPDSGDPIPVLADIINIMQRNGVFNSNINGKLYSTNFGILWGDGITPTQIIDILRHFVSHKNYAAENFVFGSGGDLMQNITRDTCKFAIKCSSVTTKHTQLIEFSSEDTYMKDIDIFKDPITDPGKKSKRGKVTTYYHPSTSTYFVNKVKANLDNPSYEVLQLVYENGKLLKDYTLDEIRNQK